jgi:hypothetical protein
MTNINQKVYVYFNLHKLLFSLKALSGLQKGRVVQHSPCVTLENVTFRVGEGGRLRVLREKRKNVHAGVAGTLVSCERLSNIPEGAIKVSYNPYKFGYFFRVEDESPISFAKKVYLQDKKIYVLEP